MDIRVGLVDYDSGNFGSVWSAFKKHDCRLHVVRGPKDFCHCSHIVLPGVGAFSTAMDKLERLALAEPLRKLFKKNETPFLGICVGMQILSESGEEFIQTNGFGVVTGSVVKFDFPFSTQRLPLPHMGWNDVLPPPNSRLFRGIAPEHSDFYFVHSYRLESDDPITSFSYADYGGKFIAAFEKGNIFGVQFHPEKSQRNGFQLIKNFLNLRLC